MKRKSFTKIIHLFLLLVCCNIFPKNVNAQTYCTPTFANGCFNWANQTINVNTLSWSLGFTDCSISDYTSMSTTLTAGTGYTMSVYSGYFTGCSVWVDWNNDGNFDEAGENMFHSYEAPASGYYTYTFTLTPPCATPTGSYRMRVIAGWGTDGYGPGLSSASYTSCGCNGYGSCGGYQYGNYDDFTINVTGIPCPPPTTLTASSITTTSVTFTWTAPSCAVSYEYVLNTTPAAPTGSGTVITGTSYTATGLTPGTTYYFHLISTCSSVDSSSWTVVPVTTLSNCGVPVTPTVSGLTTTTADYSWGVPGGSSISDYQYTLNTTGIAPTGPGTPTTSTFYDATGLTPGTTYYFYVRTMCTTGDSSAWEEVTVTTPLPCDPPTGLTPSGITEYGATITWTPAAGAPVADYVYTVSTSPSIPTGPVTSSTGTSCTLSGLTAGTTYYFYIRTMCADGDSSAWVAISFTTEPPCDTPIAVTASGILDNGATITWLTPGGATVGNYLYVLDNTPTAPTSGGTIISGNTYVATGLSPVTTYYFHILTLCADGDSSAWVTITFTTRPVCAMPNIVTDDLTDMGIHIVWNAVFEAVQYQYVLDNSPSAPSVPGTATTDTEYNMIGLNPLTTYYFHISTVCTGGVAPWETINFTTTYNTASVQNVNSNTGLNIDVNPNPAKESVTVTINGTPSGDAYVRLMDMAGQIISTTEVTGNKMTLNVSVLPQGIYFVEYTDNQNKQTVKLVK